MPSAGFHDTFYFDGQTPHTLHDATQAAVQEVVDAYAEHGLPLRIVFCPPTRVALTSPLVVATPSSLTLECGRSAAQPALPACSFDLLGNSTLGLLKVSAPPTAHVRLLGLEMKVRARLACSPCPGC